MKLMGQKP